MTFKCKRCGNCCKKMVPKNMWELGHDDLTFFFDYPDGTKRSQPKKELLLEERKKYPKNKEGCEMLVFEDGKAVCLVQKILGIEYKHPDCVNFLGQDDICG